MDWVKNEKDIEKDLKKISKKSDPKKTIYCFHAPPFNTDLDVTYSGQHVGSEAILNFIKKEQPYLSLHGHIHESPLMTSTIGQIIGKTMCFNPGDCVIMKINIDKPKDIGIINP